MYIQLSHTHICTYISTYHMHNHCKTITTKKIIPDSQLGQNDASYNNKSTTIRNISIICLIILIAE